MRFTIKTYEDGETRIRKKFLLFPKRIGNDEYRWLECATYVEKCGIDMYGTWWMPLYWVDDVNDDINQTKKQGK